MYTSLHGPPLPCFLGYSNLESITGWSIRGYKHVHVLHLNSSHTTIIYGTYISKLVKLQLETQHLWIASAMLIPYQSKLIRKRNNNSHNVHCVFWTSPNKNTTTNSPDWHYQMCYEDFLDKQLAVWHHWRYNPNSHMFMGAAIILV